MIGEIFLTFAVIYLIFSLGNYLNAKAIEARRAETTEIDLPKSSDREGLTDE